jgi:hypothetical protein
VQPDQKLDELKMRWEAARREAQDLCRATRQLTALADKTIRQAYQTLAEFRTATENQRERI